MGLIERAKLDAQTFTTNTNDFGVSITLTKPASVGSPEVSATVRGYHTKHHTSWDPESGEVIDGKRAHICVSEEELDAQSYPVRNTDQEVAMVGHRVSVADSTEVVKNYIVRQTFPDETLGLIVMILGDYGDNE